MILDAGDSQGRVGAIAARAAEARQWRHERVIDPVDYRFDQAMADREWLLGYTGALQRRVEELEGQVAEVARLHQPAPDGGQGWTGDGYGDIASACRSCGAADEYAVRWPCETASAVGAAAQGDAGGPGAPGPRTGMGTGVSEPHARAEAAVRAVIDILDGDSGCAGHVVCGTEDCHGPRARAITAALRTVHYRDAAASLRRDLDHASAESVRLAAELLDEAADLDLS